MATPPQNDAGVADVAPRWEEFDVSRRVWVSADRRVLHQLERLSGEERRRYLAARVGLLREAKGDDHGINDDGAWHCPADYDQARDRGVFLDKALKVGLLSIGGRTYKLELRGASPHQGSDRRHGTSTTVYKLTSAAGTVRYTREALLDSIARGSL